MGYALATLLAQRGAILSIADITEEGIQQAKVELEQLSAETTILAQKVDVRHAAEVSDWIDHTVNKFGCLDGAANVAGVINPVKAENPLFHEEDAEELGKWKWVFDVNVNGVANCARSQLKHMKQAASIVNVASISGLRATLGTPHGAYVRVLEPFHRSC